MKSSKLFPSPFTFFLFFLLPFTGMAQTMDSLVINRIVPKLHANGQIGQDTADWTGHTRYASDSSSVLYAANLWLAGKDSNGAIHTSCPNYIYSGDPDESHFYSGPVASAYTPSYQETYDRVWKLDRDSLEYHDQNWGNSGYQVPQMIEEWPAHGDTTNGEPYRLAPFRDHNDNGEYEPALGDRPIMRGDRALYFISNDVQGPLVQEENPFRVEVHGMLYAWDCPNNEALNNSFMVHYEIINRSQQPYDSLYVGHFNDFDIGCAANDYIGSDVERGLLFGYNGTDLDTGCQQGQYDSLPPAFGISYLKGPSVDSNNLDDAFGGVGEASVNGIGFDDGIIDNEDYGMQRGFYWGTLSIGGPQILSEYFHYLKGGPWTFGGDGTNSGNPTTRFVFPWDSDPQNYATYGNPHGFWSEDGAGNSPGDRNGLASSGPVTLEAGDTIEMDIAYIAAQDPDTTGAHSPLDELKARTDSVRSYFLADQTPCSEGSFSSLREERRSFEAKVFPNPSRGRFKIELEGTDRTYRYELYNIHGASIQEGSWSGQGVRRLDISNEEDGIYLLQLRDQRRSKVMKLIKR